MEMPVDIEKIVVYQVAQKLMEAIPEEERKKIIEASLAKTLHEVLRPWNVEKVIKDDVEKYMVEHLKRPEVQERIKSATEKSVDELMDGVISVIISKSQDGIKSKYQKFIESEE